MVEIEGAVVSFCGKTAKERELRAKARHLDVFTWEKHH